jgi:hypothetical protein
MTRTTLLSSFITDILFKHIVIHIVILFNQLLRSMIFGQISTLNLHRFSSFVDGHTPNGSENINGKLRFISVELVTKLAITNVHAGTNQLQMVELSVFKSGNLILTMTPTATLILTSLIIMIGLTMSTTNLTSKALPLSNEIGLLRIVEIASLLAWLKRQVLLMMKMQLRVQIRKQKDCLSGIHYHYLKANSRSRSWRMRMGKRTNDEYNKRLRRKG